MWQPCAGFSLDFSFAGHHVPLSLEFRGHLKFQGDIPLWSLKIIHVSRKFLVGELNIKNRPLNLFSLMLGGLEPCSMTDSSASQIHQTF